MMNELIKTEVNENQEIVVSGRELHEFLEVKERYSKWFERMISYGFVAEEDFTSVLKSTVVNNGAKRELDDHHIKIDMAKEVSMIQRTDKGKQARQYFIQAEKDNKQLRVDNTQLHSIATSHDEQTKRQYEADVIKYSWHNIKNILNDCTYKSIEDTVSDIVDFHSNVLKKRDRASYKTHKEANKTEYLQLVRDRTYSILNNIYNTTLDGSLRAITSDVKENLILDKLSTSNRRNGRIESNLRKQVEATRVPEIEDYHVINHHPFSINSQFEPVKSFDGKPFIADTRAYKKWKWDFPSFTMPKKSELNVDFKKPIKIHLMYDCKDTFDVANFEKSAIDRIFAHYNEDDKIIWAKGEDRLNKHVDSYEEGKIYFYLENIVNEEVAV